MDLISNRTKEIGAMALNGLYERQKAISANTVNVLTPDYQRKEVSFESSLRNVINKQNEKEEIKLQNAANFKNNPQDLLKSQSPAQIAFLNSQIEDDFIIDVENDQSDPVGLDGNNVVLEQEMMDEAKTGLQFQTVASLLSKSYKQLGDVIKGQNS